MARHGKAWRGRARQGKLAELYKTAKHNDKMVRVVYTKWNLANRFDDCIELNEALKDNPKLHSAILTHELGHKKSNTFKQDLFHDLTPMNRLSQKDLIVFIIKHPRTWTQFLPIYWSPKRKELVYDMNMLVIYGSIIIGIALLYYFIIR